MAERGGVFAIYALCFAFAFLATRKRASYGLALMILVDPFDFVSHVSLTTVSIPKVALLGVALGLVGRINAWNVLSQKPVKQIFFACAAIVSATTLTAIPGLYIDAVVRETLKSIEYLALFAVAAIAYAADPDERTIWLAIAGVVAIASTLALMQEHTGAPSAVLLAGRVVPRIAGPLEGPNQLAGYLDVGLSMLLAGFISRRSWTAATALVLGSIADLLTLSRAGALGILAGVLAVLAPAVRRRGHPVLFWVFGMTVSIGVVILGRVGALSRLFALDDVDYGSGLGTRSELWSAAIQFFTSHPFLGIGAGNFELEVSSLGLIGVHTHANSLYFQSLAEGGIVLFAATVAAIVVAIRFLYAASKRDPLALGAGAATIALAVHQLFDDITFFPKVGGFWWICLGIGAASLSRYNRRDQAS